MEQNIKEKGYVIIDNVLTENEIDYATQLFYDWKTKNNIIPEKNNGIIKNHNAGHQEHAWYIRTSPNIMNIFKRLLKTKELISSFDGCCYMSPDDHYFGNWTHVDQSPNNTDFSGYQGLVSLTENEQKTLVVYEGSHLMYDSYVKEKKINSDKNFLLIDEDYLQTLNKKIIPVKKGTLVIWDSRLFHQNQCGVNQEERLVQYVTYMPKNHKDNNIINQDKRVHAFLNGITTTHWCAPLKFASNHTNNKQIFNLKKYGKSIYDLI